MNDTHCLVCSEPWDIYGLAHGDVKAWEADCIVRGFGCPSCAGGELGLNYKPIEDSAFLCECNDCNDVHNIDINDIYFDGTEKIIHHNSGNVNITNAEDIQRYMGIEEDWGIIDGNLICNRCMENYTMCDACSQTISSDDAYCVDCESFCESCYDELFGRCETCDETVPNDDLCVFDDWYWCSSCLKEKTEKCSICDELVYRTEVIEGKNGERCCSEKCADECSDKI